MPKKEFTRKSFNVGGPKASSSVVTSPQICGSVPEVSAFLSWLSVIACSSSLVTVSQSVILSDSHRRKGGFFPGASQIYLKPEWKARPIFFHDFFASSFFFCKTYQNCCFLVFPLRKLISVTIVTVSLSICRYLSVSV